MSDTLRYSDTIAAFAAAFVDLQFALPKVVKDKTGQAGNQKTKYADFEGIVDAVKPVLHEHGFAYLQAASGGTGGTVSVTTILLHTSGEWMRDTLSMPTGGNGAQGVGSALTYGKRYGLASILGIATEDDDGQAASQKPAAAKTSGRAQSPRPGPTEAITKRAMAMFNEAGITEREERLAFTSYVVKHTVASWSDVNPAEADKVIGVLDQLIKGRVKVGYEDDGTLTVSESAA